MNSEEMYQQLAARAKELGVREFEPESAADALVVELKANWTEIPDSTRKLMLGIAASMKKHCADAVMSDIRAREVVRKLKG